MQNLEKLFWFIVWVRTNLTVVQQCWDKGHSIGASGWILEGIGKKDVGTRGRVKSFRVTVRPVAGSGAVILQFGAEKRTLRQTERVTLPPHPLGGAGGSQKSAENTTRPNQGWGRTETVPLCTNAHQRRQQPLPPLLITHKQTAAHFIVIWSYTTTGLLVSIQHCDQCMLCLVQKDNIF